jgi:hypothetical protein
VLRALALAEALARLVAGALGHEGVGGVVEPLLAQVALVVAVVEEAPEPAQVAPLALRGGVGHAEPLLREDLVQLLGELLARRGSPTRTSWSHDRPSTMP